MAKTLRSYNWQYSLVVLTGTVVSLVVVAALYWAQVVFVPLALTPYISSSFPKLRDAMPIRANLCRAGRGSMAVAARPRTRSLPKFEKST